jgi:hypothetical protein
MQDGVWIVTSLYALDKEGNPKMLISCWIATPNS